MRQILEFCTSPIESLPGPRSGPDEIGFAFHWASIQPGESEALIHAKFKY